MMPACQNQRRYRGCPAGQVCGEVCPTASHSLQIPKCAHGFGWLARHRGARLTGKPDSPAPRRTELATHAHKISSLVFSPRKQNPLKTGLHATV